MLCSADDAADAVCPHEEVAHAKGDADELADRIGAGCGRARGVSAVAFGPAGGSVLVAVFGHAWVDATTVHGEQRLALTAGTDGVRSVLPGALVSIRAGLGDPHPLEPQRWGNLEHGVTHAGGLLYMLPGRRRLGRAERRCARARAGPDAETAPEPAAGAGAEARAQPEPADEGAAGRASRRPTSARPGRRRHVGPGEPSACQARRAGAIQPAPEAPPGPPEPEPAAEDRPRGAAHPPEPDSDRTTAAAAATRTRHAAARAVPGRTADRRVASRPPGAARAPDRCPRLRRLATGRGAAGVQVLGVYCKNGHFDDPAARYCAMCGISMAQLTLSRGPGRGRPSACSCSTTAASSAWRPTT